MYEGAFYAHKIATCQTKMINFGNRLHSFELTEVMGNCPKFPSLVGK